MSSLVWRVQGTFAVTSYVFGLWLLNTSRKYEGFTCKENILAICTAEPKNDKDYFSNYLMLVLIGAFGMYILIDLFVIIFKIMILIIIVIINYYYY